MLIIDNLLAAPLRGLFFIFREIAEAAAREQAANERQIRADLAELYRLFDGGQLGAEEFERREAELLDRLERSESPAPLDGVISDATARQR